MSETESPDRNDAVRHSLVDENEQLRTALETALEENARLNDDRDRLQRRAALLAQELRVARATAPQPPQPQPQEGETAAERRSQTEEELRVAFEELQVLTEELEVANTSLHETNLELDARVEERTAQVGEINAALRAAEASLRTIADLVPDLLWRTDPAGNANWFNERWFDYTGHDPAEPMGLGWIDAIHPLDRPEAAAAWREAVERGDAYDHAHRLRGAKGDYRWFLVRAEPMRDDRGKVVSWFAAGTDVHDQRQAMEALQHSELRFRTLVEGMPQLVWRAIDSGQWTWSSPQWTSYTGLSDEQSRGMGWLDAIHPDDRDKVRAAWACASDMGILELEARVLHAPAGRHRHFQTRALPVRDEVGSIIEWLGTSTDVDDLLRLQQHQSVLVAELQHRTRNLMTVVQAITLRTLRSSDSLATFKECIGHRLDALARVQSLLSRREGARVAFDVLLREELSAHVELDAEGQNQQVTLAGPAGVGIRSALVQTLALALHELSTNAVKYGALAAPAGHLAIVWHVAEGANGQKRLFVDWRESGVENLPGRDAPSKGGGFGRELIERALPYQLGARTNYEFEPDGIHCTIDVEVPDDALLETING
ncbi:MAG: PAS domain-containing protein [Sphingomonadales bacterium]|nr:PAS domain-containing protein [Sphingomonadales bacterium]